MEAPGETSELAAKEAPLAEAPQKENQAPGEAPKALPEHEVLPAGSLLEASIYDLDVSFENQDKKALSLDSLKGKPVLVSMFYERCGFACPTLIQDIKNIERKLPEEARKNLQVLLVTFDNEADTPESLKKLAQTHALDESRWTLARTPLDTGDELTRELAGALGIKYRKLSDNINYNHSTIITLLDQSGVPKARLTGLGQNTDALVQTLHSLLP